MSDLIEEFISFLTFVKMNAISFSLSWKWNRLNELCNTEKEIYWVKHQLVKVLFSIFNPFKNQLE